MVHRGVRCVGGVCGYVEGNTSQLSGIEAGLMLARCARVRCRYHVDIDPRLLCLSETLLCTVEQVRSQLNDIETGLMLVRCACVRYRYHVDIDSRSFCLS